MCARSETRHRLQQHRHTTRRQGRCNTLAQHPLAEAMAQPGAGTLTSDTSQTKRSSEKSRSNRRFHQTAKCIRQLSASGRKARQTAKLVRENSHQTEQSSDNSAQPSVKPAAAEHGPARLREAPGRATEPGNGCEHPTTERTGSPSNDQGRRQRINPASSNGPVPLKRRVLASARARSPRRPHSNNSA